MHSIFFVYDSRFQGDSLHWLGITKIDNFISMSDMKYNAAIVKKLKDVKGRGAKEY